jgi:hypothetical protein
MREPAASLVGSGGVGPAGFHERDLACLVDHERDAVVHPLVLD